MYLLPRRTPAVIATATTLAAGSMLVPAIPTASAVNPAGPVTTQELLGGLLGLLDTMETMTDEELQAALAVLTPEEIGDLLVAADPDQLTRLLDVLTTTQLTDALATLDAFELTSVVEELSPAQITSLLDSDSGTASVLSGLNGIATEILNGGTPGAATVDPLLAQVEALLGGGLPLLDDQLATMNSLLTSVTSLVSTEGVDTTLLTTLLDTANATLASALPDADTDALERLIAETTTVLGEPITAPITDPITDITDPITDPITDITAPITDPPTPDATPTDPIPPPSAMPPVPSIVDLIPSTGKFTAKLGLARATVMRSDRQIDVLAPITARASGRVNVNLFAARRHHRFTAPVDSTNGRVRFQESIPKAQADLGTGIMTIDYAGDDDTRPQSVRLRAASRPAALDLERPTLIDGRLKASGTVTSKARGVVRTELQYLFLGQTKTLKFKARIKDGKWQLDQKLPDTALGEIIYRTGSVHSYTLFTGYFPERIRGEMRSYQVLGDRP